MTEANKLKLKELKVDNLINKIDSDVEQCICCYKWKNKYNMSIVRFGSYPEQNQRFVCNDC